jgi:DNA-binding CsgD family transcriptional regulator
LSAELLAAFARRYRLPTREIEALRFLLEGHTHKKMVKLMGCKFATVKSHCARLYAKLGVHNHLGLVYKVLSFRSSSPALNERERKRRSKRAAKVYGRMPAKVAQQNSRFGSLNPMGGWLQLRMYE